MTKLPRNIEAEEQYRQAYWRHKEILQAFKRDPVEQLRLEQLMDSLQTAIAPHPADPRWQEFLPTLNRAEPLLQKWKRKLFGP